MTYTPYYPGGWQNDPTSTATPITAPALQNIENGLVAASAAIPAFDTTVSDIQPSGGNASLGASLKILRSDHAHPSWPWQFYQAPLGGGSDDAGPTAALIAEATTYALNHQGKAQIIQSDGVFNMAKAPTIGAPFGGNAIIPVMPQTATGMKPVIEIISMSGSSTPPVHWLQRVPQASGTVWYCPRTDGYLDNNYGPSVILGGPVYNYGGGNGTFSNIEIVLDGITFQVPGGVAGVYGGFDFYGHAAAYVKDAAYIPAAVVPSGTGYPQFSGNETSYAFGGRMPAVGNNDRCDIGQFTVYGAQVGLLGNEHMTFDTLRTVYCGFGIVPMSNNGGNPSHGITGRYWSCEGVNTPIAALSSGYYALAAPIGLRIAQLDLESYSGGTIVSDTQNFLTGEVWFNDLSPMGSYYTGGVMNGGANLALKFTNRVRGMQASPVAPPASGAAQGNYYYGDATWYVSAATSISGISIDSVATGMTAGANVVIPVRVPGGHTWTPTYSGTMTVHGISVE